MGRKMDNSETREARARVVREQLQQTRIKSTELQAQMAAEAMRRHPEVPRHHKGEILGLNGSTKEEFARRRRVQDILLDLRKLRREEWLLRFQLTSLNDERRASRRKG